MDIAQKLNKYLSEGKEMTLKKVMDKIDDGYWEAMEDVKVGKHVTIRDTKTNRKIVVYITEDLDESKASLIVSAVKSDIGLSEKQFKIAHLTGNIESPKNNDKCIIVFKANGKPKFKVYTFDSSNKWVAGESFTDSSKLKSLWKDFPNVDYNLNEASQEKDLDPNKKIVVKGVKGMKSSPFTKKFKNQAALDKWLDSDASDDFEVHQIMNEDFDDSELEVIEEATKMPLTLKIGDTIKTDAGTLKITDITVSSLHINPITYITYKYDVMLDGKNVKGEEKASVSSFKDHFKN